MRAKKTFKYIYRLHSSGSEALAASKTTGSENRTPLRLATFATKTKKTKIVDGSQNTKQIYEEEKFKYCIDTKGYASSIKQSCSNVSRWPGIYSELPASWK